MDDLSIVLGRVSSLRRARSQEATGPLAGRALGAELGHRLRAIRQARGHSLSQVAEATALSTSFLSLVENGRRGITIDRLMRLVGFYDLRLGDLVPDQNRLLDTHAEIVVRGPDARRLDFPTEGITMYLLAGDSKRAMMPALFEFEPGGHSAELTSHEGEEFVYVLDGEIELVIEPEQAQTLGRGDTAYFQAERLHAYRNVGTGVARMIAVVTPPSI